MSITSAALEKICVISEISGRKQRTAIDLELNTNQCPKGGIKPNGFTQCSQGRRRERGIIGM